MTEKAEGGCVHKACGRCSVKVKEHFVDMVIIIDERLDGCVDGRRERKFCLIYQKKKIHKTQKALLRNQKARGDNDNVQRKPL